MVIACSAKHPQMIEEANVPGEQKVGQRRTTLLPLAQDSQGGFEHSVTV